MQDHRSCSFDSRSGGEKPKGAKFTPGSRTIASVLSESESENANDSLSQDLTARGSSCVSWHEKAEIVESDALQCETDEAPEVMETSFVVDAEPVSKLKEHEIVVEAVQDNKPRVMEMDSEDETESEGDDFVDALYTIDSESENDQMFKTTEEVQKKSTSEITEERLDNSVCEQETEKVSNNFSDGETICAAASGLHLSSSSSPVNKSDEMIHQDPWAASVISNGTHSYSNGFSNPLYDISGIQEHQESEAETESIKTWTNGNLLGLKPSKPKIVAATIPENDEDLDVEDKAPFDWFTSSPPLDHMKISFNPSETLPRSEMKLKLPDEYTFSSFQLVPETVATSLPDSDSDKDSFCRSSSYISDNSDNHSVSMSEQQWEEESGEILRESKSQQKLYDSFHRINAEASSLSAPTLQIETSNGYLAGNLSYLQNPAEPSPPPLPPLQWMVSKIPSGRFEDNKKQSLKETLIRAFEQNNSLSTVKKEQPSVVTAYDPKPENNVWRIKFFFAFLSCFLDFSV